jgi:hypothetical protein
MSRDLGLYSMSLAQSVQPVPIDLMVAWFILRFVIVAPADRTLRAALRAHSVSVTDALAIHR